MLIVVNGILLFDMSLYCLFYKATYLHRLHGVDVRTWKQCCSTRVRSWSRYRSRVLKLMVLVSDSGVKGLGLGLKLGH